MANSQEHRKYPRVAEAVSCQVRVSNAPVVTFTHNISCGGALCALSRKVKPLTRLDMALELPEDAESASHLIRCTGVVVRQEAANGDGYFPTAIFFQKIKTQDRRRLAEFVLQSMLSHARQSFS